MSAVYLMSAGSVILPLMVKEMDSARKPWDVAMTSNVVAGYATRQKRISINLMRHLFHRNSSRFDFSPTIVQIFRQKCYRCFLVSSSFFLLFVAFSLFIIASITLVGNYSSQGWEVLRTVWNKRKGMTIGKLSVYRINE